MWKWWMLWINLPLEFCDAKDFKYCFKRLIDVIIIQNGDAREIQSENSLNIKFSFWFI